MVICLPKLRFLSIVVILGMMLASILLWLSSQHVVTPTSTTDLSGSKQEAIQPILQNMFRVRSQSLLTADIEPLKPLYDTSVVYGRWALEHEIGRVKYIREWVAKRNVQLNGVTTAIKIWQISPRQDGIWVYLKQNMVLTYSYMSDPRTPNRLAIGTRHTVQLVPKGDQWLIRRDWYTDPLEEDTLVPEVMPASLPVEPTGLPTSASGDASGEQMPATASYYRQKAVAYAVKFSGTCIDGTPDGGYNPKYRDYTGIGGDCTNFVSQVLADKEAGGLPMDGTWYYRFPTGGSKTWVQTDAFANYLMYSGKASRILRGNFQQAVRPSKNHPRGAIQELRPGDLIAYEEKNDVQHFAVIVGYNSNGYALVNSHTADRCLVPWDLGWDQKTVFWLFKMNY